MSRDGQPMVEKTIFIVKPIYVNAEDVRAPKKMSKHKIRKQIYSEKMRPPPLIKQPAPDKSGKMPKLANQKKKKMHRRDKSPRAYQQQQENYDRIVSINNNGSIDSKLINGENSIFSQNEKNDSIMNTQMRT